MMTWPKLPPVSVKVLEKYCPWYDMIGILMVLYLVYLWLHCCVKCMICVKRQTTWKIVLMAKYHLLMQPFY